MASRSSGGRTRRFCYGEYPGIMLIVSPFDSIATLALMAGMWLIVPGLVEMVHGIRRPQGGPLAALGRSGARRQEGAVR